MIRPASRVFAGLFAFAALLAGCQSGAAQNGAIGAASPAPVTPAVVAGSPPVAASPAAAPAASPYGFDATRAYGDLQAQCAFGPRYSGSAGYPKMRDWLVKSLSDASGLPAKRQDFVGTPGGKSLPMSNVYVAFNPQAKTQVLLCAHWDTRPTADQEIDPAKKKMPIPGADDGASGVAALLEVARVFKKKAPTVGVQIVFFDGEDYGPGDKEMYLGARAYAKAMPLPKPTYGVLIDMIGDSSLKIYREQFSEDNAPGINDKVFNAAALLHENGFNNVVKYAITDDHEPLQKVGVKIIDLIDFDYGPWHTLDDTPDKCSGASLQSVGDVLAKVVYDET